MKTEIMTILISLVASSLAVFPSVIGTDAGTIGASLEVRSNCNLVVDPTSINFGLLNAGVISGIETVNMKDDAASSNLPSTVSLSGNDWGVGFLVDNTKYTFTGGSETALTGSAIVIGTVPQDSVGKDVSFTVSVPANQPAGPYSQTITVTFECEQAL